MTSRTSTSTTARVPLSRERVLAVALDLADQGGLESLTMRKLGQELGVEAMALYYHFAKRDEIVDGIVDLVFGEVHLPAASGAWRLEMRQRGISLRDVLLRHRWAIGLMESRRNPGSASLRHHDAVIGSLRAGGFSMAMAAHAYSVLDSYIYGFVSQEATLASAGPAAEEQGEYTRSQPVEEYPYLIEASKTYAAGPGWDFDEEFAFGLDMILEALDRQLNPS